MQSVTSKPFISPDFVVSPTRKLFQKKKKNYEEKLQKF